MSTNDVKVNKKPRLRFKEFTEDWEQRKFENIFEYERPDKYIVKSDKYIEHSNIPVLTANKAFILGYTDENNPYKKEDESIIFDDFTLDTKFVDFPYMVKSSAIKILTLKSKVKDNIRFNYELLSKTKFNMLGHARHYISVVQPEEVYTTNKVEQDKIASVLARLDNLITLHQSKLNKIVDMKKSLLEKIFPQNNSNVPALRFKNFNDAWEQRKLGDACKINGRIGFRGYTEKDIITKDAGGVLTFSPTNIIDNKLTMDCKNTYITREKYEESPEIMIENGDILFVKTGSTLGKSTLVTGLEEDASINPQIVVMRTEKGTESFLSSVLITQDVLKQVAEVKIGGAVPTMTETELKNFIYSEPSSKEEKSKIGIFFRRLDNLITLHQNKLENLKNMKKSLLEKMFV